MVSGRCSPGAYRSRDPPAASPREDLDRNTEAEQARLRVGEEAPECIGQVRVLLSLRLESITYCGDAFTVRPSSIRPANAASTERRIEGPLPTLKRIQCWRRSLM